MSVLCSMAKEMSARESDDPSAASDEEQCSVTARPAAIRAARRRAICEPFTECLSGIATGSTNIELEGEILLGAIFWLEGSFSMLIVDQTAVLHGARAQQGGREQIRRVRRVTPPSGAFGSALPLDFA